MVVVVVVVLVVAVVEDLGISRISGVLASDLVSESDSDFSVFSDPSTILGISGISGIFPEAQTIGLSSCASLRQV